MTVKIELARVDIQKRITVEELLDSEAAKLVVSIEFIRKYKLKLKRLEKSFYKEYRERIKINIVNNTLLIA